LHRDSQQFAAGVFNFSHIFYYEREDGWISTTENAIGFGRDGILEIKDRKAVSSLMDGLIYEAVFAEEERKRGLLLLVKEIAKACGAVPASIQGLYEEMGRNYPGFTVPAINIRGLHMMLPGQSLERPLKQRQGRLYLK